MPYHDQLPHHDLPCRPRWSATAALATSTAVATIVRWRATSADGDRSSGLHQIPATDANFAPTSPSAPTPRGRARRSETDVDCGGQLCGAHEDGLRCGEDTDCLSELPPRRTAAEHPLCAVCLRDEADHIATAGRRGGDPPRSTSTSGSRTSPTPSMGSRTGGRSSRPSRASASTPASSRPTSSCPPSSSTPASPSSSRRAYGTRWGRSRLGRRCRTVTTSAICCLTFRKTASARRRTSRTGQRAWSPRSTPTSSTTRPRSARARRTSPAAKTASSAVWS